MMEETPLNLSFDEIANIQSQVTSKSLEHVNHKFVKIDDEILKRAFMFAFNMAKKEKHRPNRSGGVEKRKPNRVFLNVLTGKLGEEAYRQVSLLAGRTCSEVDYRVFDRGSWDEGDLFEYYGIKRNYISVKTIQHFSSYLLLERKDYSPKERLYRELKKKVGATALCRVKFPCQLNELFNRVDFNDPIQEFERLLSIGFIYVSYCGFVSNENLIKAIDKQEENKKYFHQGQPLGGSKMTLDADNYYMEEANMMKGLPEKYPR